MVEIRVSHVCEAERPSGNTDKAMSVSTNADSNTVYQQLLTRLGLVLAQRGAERSRGRAGREPSTRPMRPTRYHCTNAEPIL